MTLRDKIILWLLTISLFFLGLYSISSILFPFICAIIIAYFLDPLVNKLQKINCSRSLASIIMVIVFVATISLFGLAIIPIFYKELIALIEAIPGYYTIFLNDTYPKILDFFDQNGYDVSNGVRSYFDKESLGKIFSFSDNIIGSIFSSSIAFINILSLVFITPILVFYLLKDWGLLIKNVNSYLPSKYAFKIRKIFIMIDRTLSGYIHGQFNVCLILGFIYALGLIAIGLDFGFLIGFFTGIMSFVPYVGMLLGVAVAILIALFQWGFDIGQIGIVSMVFVFGQIIESNFLTPKLVGQKIGLHPVWVIFAVFAFGVLFGFVGILLAVPMAAVLGVLIKFMAIEYKKAFVKN